MAVRMRRKLEEGVVGDEGAEDGGSDEEETGGWRGRRGGV